MLKAFKLNQSARAVKIDVYNTIRPFQKTPGTKVDCKSSEVWRFLNEIAVNSSETCSTFSGGRGGECYKRWRTAKRRWLLLLRAPRSHISFNHFSSLESSDAQVS